MGTARRICTVCLRPRTTSCKNTCIASIQRHIMLSATHRTNTRLSLHVIHACCGANPQAYALCCHSRPLTTHVAASLRSLVPAVSLDRQPRAGQRPCTARPAESRDSSRPHPVDRRLALPDVLPDAKPHRGRRRRGASHGQHPGQLLRQLRGVQDALAGRLHQLPDHLSDALLGTMSRCMRGVRPAGRMG